MPTYEEYVDLYGPELFKYMGPYISAHPEYIDSHENAKMIIDYFRTNNLPITAENVAMAVRKHAEAGWKVNLTKEEQALDAARTSLGTSYELFSRWFSYQHIEKTPRAEIAIINECKGHQVTKEALDQFLGRAASKGLITFVKAPDHVSYQPGQYSGRDLRDSIPASDVYDCFGKKLIQTPHKLSQQAQAVLDAEAEKVAQRPNMKDEAYWKDQAERAAQANRYSRKLELERIVVTNPDRTINWERTALERKKMQDQDPSR